MSESCVSSPTLTTTREITTQGLTTTSTASITTGTPITTTIISISSCPVPLSSSVVSCIPTTLSVISTIPGQIQTLQVPITLTVPVTNTEVATLWGSSCTTIDKPADPTSPPPSPPPTSSTPSSTPSASVIVSESSSTQSNGSIVVQTVTSTSMVTPGNPTDVHLDSDKSDSPDIAPIIGGAVGGFFGLIALVAFIWFILKRRRRWNDIFEKDDDIIAAVGSRRNGRFSLDVDAEPKPYQYGLVGHTTAPHPVSPPNSPPLRPSMAAGPGLHHARNNSLTPLNAPMSTLSSHPSASTVSSRPSTQGSLQPLRPSSQQGYPPQQQSRSGEFGQSGSNAHSHSHSNVSSTSPVMQSNWTTSPAPGYNAGTGNDQLYNNRSGSPTSIQEQPARRLQVANAVPLSPPSEMFSFSEPFSSSAAAAASASATAVASPQRDGKGRLRISSQKPPLVHLDGGRVQQELDAASGVAGSSGPSPPAYEA